MKLSPSFLHQLMLIVTLLLLSACATRPKAPIPENNWQQRQHQLAEIKQWTATGRMGIKAPEQRNSFNFNWQQNSDKQQFLLFELGVTYAQLSQSKENAVLELSDNRVYQSSDVETLLTEVLGYPLPIEHMRYWVMGLPYPGDDSELTYDKQGYLKSIDYQQWQISYSKYQLFDAFPDNALPAKITITDSEVTIKLSLRGWSLDTEL